MCNLYIGGTYSNFMSKKSSSQPHGPPCKQTRMEAIERLRFLASFGPPVPGTGKRKGGEKTQTFNRFHSHPGTNWTALCICNVHHRKNSVASGHSCGLGVEELRLWPHLEAKLRMTQNIWFSCSMLVPTFSLICHISVKNLSENCQFQKSVWKLYELCQIYVRNQIQLSVIIMSSKIWKCLKNVLEEKNLLGNCHCSISKTVRNQSQISLMLWNIY